jgi:hypothetical protein
VELTWNRSRTLAVGGLVAGGAAALAAVVAALSSPGTTVAEAKAASASATLSSRNVAFPGGRVVSRLRPGGLACFTVSIGSSKVGRSCFRHLYPDEIVYASSRHAVGGLAGSDVRAVIVKLTRKGTVWATLRRGAFYAQVPKRHSVRAVIKVLRDGSRKRFAVSG